ncbi:MAG TPA: hypothetical protein VEB22_06310 [Phycisphaerales bacterium]|nr:hypothetical protein [Phycisphaerales bacterium]
MARTNRGWTMVACVSTVAAVGAIAGLAVRGGAAATATATKAPLPTVLALPAVSTLAAPGPVQGPGPFAQVRDCVYGISKDTCEGRLKGDSFYQTGCDDAPIPCRTFHLDNAAWEFPLVSSNLNCATTPFSHQGWCDEFRERTDGRFLGRVSLIIREQETCRYRGTIDGEGEYSMNDGSVYRGRLVGVYGIGADRAPACSTDARSCENCLDVQWIQAEQPYWRFGVEVIFDGYRVDQPTGERIRLNISGSLTTPGGPGAPDKLYSYRFSGTADGVLIYTCN